MKADGGIKPNAKLTSMSALFQLLLTRFGFDNNTNTNKDNNKNYNNNNKDNSNNYNKNNILSINDMILGEPS